MENRRIEQVVIPVEGELSGDLTPPAARLPEAGIVALPLDLLTPEEAKDSADVLDISLLIEPSIELNQVASEKLSCEKRLEIVHGATHPIEVPELLDTVVESATDWFAEHLADPVSGP